jgi:hypothetical protein
MKTNTIPASMTSHDQKVLEKFIKEWCGVHGELRNAVQAKWEVCSDDIVRWFPAKLFRLQFSQTHAELRMDTETRLVTVTKHPELPKTAPAAAITSHHDDASEDRVARRRRAA